MQEKQLSARKTIPTRLIFGVRRTKIIFFYRNTIQSLLQTRFSVFFDENSIFSKIVLFELNYMMAVHLFSYNTDAIPNCLKIIKVIFPNNKIYFD